MSIEYDKMLQEELMPDAWKMLVGCIMLNQTTRVQVEKVWRELFDRYPTPESMSLADPDELSELIKCCGFRNRRAKTLVRFSKEWSCGDREVVSKYYGIGKYAHDSYRIFVENDFNVDTVGLDKELRRYLQEKGMKL